MGAILKPTPEMGYFRVEVRNESAYLKANLGDYNAWYMGERPDPPHRTIHGDPHGFAVLVEDLPNLLAAVDQVIDHPAYGRWWSRVDPSAHTSADQWSVDIVGDMARIHGPVWIADRSSGPVGSVEVEYAVMSGLRTRLGVLVDERAAGHRAAPRLSDHPAFKR